MRRDILEAYDTSGRSSNWRFGSVMLVAVSPKMQSEGGGPVVWVSNRAGAA